MHTHAHSSLIMYKYLMKPTGAECCGFKDKHTGQILALYAALWALKNLHLASKAQPLAITPVNLQTTPPKRFLSLP